MHSFRGGRQNLHFGLHGPPHVAHGRSATKEQRFEQDLHPSRVNAAAWTLLQLPVEHVREVVAPHRVLKKQHEEAGPIQTRARLNPSIWIEEENSRALVRAETTGARRAQRSYHVDQDITGDTPLHSVSSWEGCKRVQVTTKLGLSVGFREIL